MKGGVYGIIVGKFAIDVEDAADMSLALAQWGPIPRAECMGMPEKQVG